MDQRAETYSLVKFQMVSGARHNMWRHELLGGGLLSGCFSTWMTTRTCYSASASADCGGDVIAFYKSIKGSKRVAGVHKSNMTMSSCFI